MAAIFCFSYGEIASIWNLWPSETYERAFEAYRVDKLQRKEINEVMSNPELLKSKRLNVIASAAHTKTLEEDKVQPGLTLIAVGSDAAMLIDMSGQMLHSWHLPFSTAFGAAPPHVRDPNPDEMTRFIDAQLFPNGDLLAIYHADNDTPYGYGMVKMDKDSNVLWALAKNVHHDMYVAHDERIYALTQSFIEDYASHIPYYKSPVLADAIAIISPEGKLEDSISIVEAFIDTPYEPFLNAKVSDNDNAKHDYTHANSVMLLEEDIAPKFPMFSAGQLLVSLRNISTIAVIDPKTHKVVWATRGVWKEQHEAQFLANGHIMLFDNLGYTNGSTNKPRSRLLEINPSDGAIEWFFKGTPNDQFYSSFHGSQQVLPGGNILTVETAEGNRLMEITPDKKIVWKYSLNSNDFRINPINKAYRVDPETLEVDFRASLSAIKKFGKTKEAKIEKEGPNSKPPKDEEQPQNENKAPDKKDTSSPQQKKKEDASKKPPRDTDGKM